MMENFINQLINRKNIAAVFVGSALLLPSNPSAFAQRYSALSTTVNIGATINTVVLEDCPFLAPDNLNFFFASDWKNFNTLILQLNLNTKEIQ